MENIIKGTLREQQIHEFFIKNKDDKFVPAEIAEKLGMTKSSVSTTCTLLRKIGLIKVVGLRKIVSVLTREYQHMDGPLARIEILSSIPEGYISLEHFLNLPNINIGPSPFRTFIMNTNFYQDGIYVDCKGSVLLSFPKNVLDAALRVYLEENEQEKTSLKENYIKKEIKEIFKDIYSTFSSKDIQKALIEKNTKDITLERIRVWLNVLEDEGYIKIVSLIEDSSYNINKIYQNSTGPLKSFKFISSLKGVVIPRVYLKSQEVSEDIKKKLIKRLKEEASPKYYRDLNKVIKRVYTKSDVDFLLRDVTIRRIRGLKAHEKMQEYLMTNKTFTSKDISKKLKTKVDSANNIIKGFLNKGLIRWVDVKKVKENLLKVYSSSTSPFPSMVAYSLKDGYVSLSSFTEKHNISFDNFRNFIKEKNIKYKYVSYCNGSLFEGYLEDDLLKLLNIYLEELKKKELKS